MKYDTEYELVERFIGDLAQSNSTTDQWILLREMKSDWGVVDLLAIRFNGEMLAKRRNEILGPMIVPFSSLAAYAMVFLIDHRTMTISDLGSFLKAKNGRLRQVLDQLIERNLVIRHKTDSIRARAISTTFMIKDILAFEAKLSKWQSAITQAERHLWFTNSSFVVLPHLSASVYGKALAACTDRGVGLITSNESGLFKVAKEPLHKDRIESHFAWKINESLVDGSLMNAAIRP
ncbi:MAG: hypothetical protein NTZ35_08965 [Ignavibacteriales bacterium]|nr:hypothetical protein [Ignavibacteriales bacterium]